MPSGRRARGRAAARVSAEHRAALFAGVEPLEVFVDLLADLDTDTSSTEFYDRVCEAICRLTTMRRAAIFMADIARRTVRVVGSYGSSLTELARLEPTAALISTPIAQRALLEDQVVVITQGIEDALPAEYAELFGITTLVCTPLSAAGRAYGVICADRGGGRFELTDGERHLLWTLGKTAALVATARNATRQQERTRRLGERLELAREIHERVMQRLFGVSLALGAEKFDADQRERCLVEMQEALSDLRRALERPLAVLPSESGTTLASELRRAADGPGPPVKIGWEHGVTVPPQVESLAQSVLAEALRNITKHAEPSEIEVLVAGNADTFSMEVRNDGTSPGAQGAGMGLRLAAFEALQHGGTVEFGAPEAGRWRVRLVVPLDGD